MSFRLRYIQHTYSFQHTHAFRVRELCCWTLTFAPKVVENEEEGSVGKSSNVKSDNDEEDEVESVGEFFDNDGNETHFNKDEENMVAKDIVHQPTNSDPFELESLITKNGHYQKQEDEVTEKHVGVSMIQPREDTIKVGTALGFNMEGCQDMLAKIIADMGDKVETKMLRVDLWTLRQVWGNSQFDFTSTSAWGRLGGILCIWNKLLFHKERIISVDNYVAVQGSILEKGIPDHRPILLKEYVVDYGPTPFHFFHSWLDSDEFLTWLLIRGKLLIVVKVMKEHQSRLSLIDVKVDQGVATRDDLNCRISSMKILSDINLKEASDIAQKAMVKWAIGGDENTFFLHSSLKKKRRQCAIKVILHNGVWIDDPGEIFVEQCEFLERDVSNEEIKKAVWDCGGDRASSPDGFTFKFFKTFWEVIQNDVVRFIREFFQSACFPKGPSSRRSYVSLIFIHAMEGLHAMVSKAVNTGLFKGASIGHGSINLSHLLYADDAIFVGEWSHSNAYNLICLLRCFYMVSGLKINVHKSKLLGVNVPDEEVSNMALVLGCGVAKLPMMYLGVPVGCNVGRCDYWKCTRSVFGKKAGVKFPRVYALEVNKSCTVAQRINIEDWPISSARSYIDKHTLLGSSTSTRWLRYIPIKVNVFIWKLRLDKLPTLANMDKKGIDVASLLCPVCNAHVENVDHLFFSCGMAHDLWGLLARWCTLDISEVSNIVEWFSWLDATHVSKHTSTILEGIASTML
nr:hypothetical protein [Tanacetum cinerariifolium]